MTCQLWILMQEQTDINGLYWLYYYSILFSLILQLYTPGHVTLGTAYSAGPPHLIPISLCSSLHCVMSQGLVLSNMPRSSWFSNKIRGRATLKKRKETLGFKSPTAQLEHWYTFQVGSIVQHGQYVQCSCFLCSLLSLCVGESGQAQVFPIEKRSE